MEEKKILDIKDFNDKIIELSQINNNINILNNISKLKLLYFGHLFIYYQNLTKLDIPQNINIIDEENIILEYTYGENNEIEIEVKINVITLISEFSFYIINNTEKKYNLKNIDNDFKLDLNKQYDWFTLTINIEKIKNIKNNNNKTNNITINNKNNKGINIYKISKTQKRLKATGFKMNNNIIKYIIPKEQQEINERIKKEKKKKKNIAKHNKKINRRK